MKNKKTREKEKAENYEYDIFLGIQVISTDKM